MKSKTIILLSLLIILLVQRVTVSGAYFTDSVIIGGITISTGSWVPLLNPSLEFSLRGDKKAVSFSVSEISDYNKLSYEIVYDSNNGEKGIAGSVDLSGENSFARTDLLLGSCSEIEGKICTYDEGITKLHLKVTLFLSGEQTILKKEINY